MLAIYCNKGEDQKLAVALECLFVQPGELVSPRDNRPDILVEVGAGSGGQTSHEGAQTGDSILLLAAAMEVAPTGPFRRRERKDTNVGPSQRIPWTGETEGPGRVQR